MKRTFPTASGSRRRGRGGSPIWSGCWSAWPQRPNSTTRSICRSPGASETRARRGRGCASPDESCTATRNRYCGAAMFRSPGNSMARRFPCGVSRGRRRATSWISFSTPPPCGTANYTASATPMRAGFIAPTRAAASRSSSLACRRNGACRCAPTMPDFSSRTACRPATWNCFRCSSAPKSASTSTTPFAKANPRGCMHGSYACSARFWE